jgi:hypothetical protein
MDNVKILNITAIQWRTEPQESDVIVHSPNEFDIFEWCFENNIDADFVSKYVDGIDSRYKSLWNVPDDHQRLLFILRWGN